MGGQLQRSATSAEDVDEVPPIVYDVLRSPGRPLDTGVRTFMESRFGADFSGVRIHTDARAAESAAAVNANAYTVGQHVAFGEGRYAPGSGTGRSLLAHELTHVLQQPKANSRPFSIGTSGASEQEAQVIEDHVRHNSQTLPAPKVPSFGVLRQENEAEKKAPDVPLPDTIKGKSPSSKRATKTHELELGLLPAVRGTPCACIAFVHNDERNARLTAQALHEHCQYNLAMVSAVDKERERALQGDKPKNRLDPNSLFDSEWVATCRSQPNECEKVLAETSADTLDSTREAARVQFFLTIRACSDNFRLPVIALHNNKIDDTAAYTNDVTKTGVPVGLEGMSIDKRNPRHASEQLAELESRLGTHKSIMKKEKRTSIFRWCQSGELEQCHIGDPKNPDTVTWVTNREDFAALAKLPVNVVLQTTAKKESEGDLSTLFLTLGRLAGNDAAAAYVEREMGRMTPKDADARIEAALASQRSLRFVNVETPHTPKQVSDDTRLLSNYDAIVSILKPLGLHCCSEPSNTAVKESITRGAAAERPPKPVPKPKKAKKRP
jgi:hypothetical protein